MLGRAAAHTLTMGRQPRPASASPLATSLMVMTMGTSEAVGKLWPPAVTRDKLINLEQTGLPKGKDPRILVVWILTQIVCAKLKLFF